MKSSIVKRMNINNEEKKHTGKNTIRNPASIESVHSVCET